MEDNLVYAFFLLLPAAMLLTTCLFFFRYRQHRKATWRLTRLVAGNLLVLGLLLSLGVLVGETYYRFGYDTTDSFGLTKTHQRWMERHYSTLKNNEGFRDDVDYAPRIPPGKRRVTFLGDSFTAGHGIKNVGDRFANRIRHGRPEWDVHVLAGLGNNTEEELNLLLKLLVNRDASESGESLAPVDPSGRIILDQDKLGRTILGRDRMGRVVMRDLAGKLSAEPDVDQRFAGFYGFDYVVLVFCLNDIADEVPQWPGILDRIHRDSKPNWLGQHSYLFNTLHYRLYAARDPDLARYFQFTLAAYDPAGTIWPHYQSRLAKLHSAVVTGGGELLVVTFPYLDQLGADYRFRAVHKQLDQFWKDLGVPHLDLLPVYERNLQQPLVVSRFDAHPNENAHRIAAEAIDDFLVNVIRNRSLGETKN